ncbi:MAG: PfkB family carbohydrate kinase [Pseudomonadota bacterium]
MDLSCIPDVLDRLANTRVLVVGDAMLDRYVYGSTDRVSREAPVPVILYDREESKLGGAGNAARNVAALGGLAVLATVLGDDEGGQGLRRELTAAGILDPAVIEEQGRITLTKLRVLAGAPGTGKQQVLRLDRQAATPPSAASCLSLLKATGREAARAQAVLVSDYGGRTVSEELWQYLAKVASEKPVLVDSRYDLLRIRGPFVLKPNAPELAEATGLPTGDNAQVERAARILLERSGAQAVLCTRGRAGMCLVEPRGNTAWLPIFGSDDVTDVTGAGDTVAAAVVLALGSGATLDDAMRLATVASGLVVQKQGAATVSPSEIRAALQGDSA